MVTSKFPKKLSVRFTKSITPLNLYIKSHPIKNIQSKILHYNKLMHIDKWFVDKSKFTLPHTFKKSPPADFKMHLSSGVDFIGIRKLRTNVNDTIDSHDPVSNKLGSIYL